MFLVIYTKYKKLYYFVLLWYLVTSSVEVKFEEKYSRARAFRENQPDKFQQQI
ncbi:hypothetical protein C8_411 [Cannes 8 virus]|uniref:Uncharacterized protein n=1 Tax=Marseillevirus marseillevirus TaxID=694581 RepID=D2XA79_GBMV|nr:hypothetical protein MAR_ORF071 [Marseillevirus marseillevirus]ADB03856.1 hypothetical protein MAR_ORF071 [Marseillevirus marseillevirus]AGV01760.1 hypothetical protein C8_411 [Cannes 8 virus]AVR53109.1 hypothetical protein MarSH_404 [Marseillevirus Shanghai 1]